MIRPSSLSPEHDLEPGGIRVRRGVIHPAIPRMLGLALRRAAQEQLTASPLLFETHVDSIPWPLLPSAMYMSRLFPPGAGRMSMIRCNRYRTVGVPELSMHKDKTYDYRIVMPIHKSGMVHVEDGREPIPFDVGDIMEINNLLPIEDRSYHAVVGDEPGRMSIVLGRTIPQISTLG